MNDQECELDLTSPECIEYGSKLQELATLLQDQKSKIQDVRRLAQDLRHIQLVAPKVPVTVQDGPALRRALQAAKSMVEAHGATSAEARLAWEAVEEIASNDQSMVGKLDLDEECLVETLQACEAMEQLQAAVFLEQSKVNGRYHG